MTERVSPYPQFLVFRRRVVQLASPVQDLAARKMRAESGDAPGHTHVPKNSGGLP